MVFSDEWLSILGLREHIKCFAVEINGDYIFNMHWSHKRFFTIDYPNKAEDCPTVIVPSTIQLHFNGKLKCDLMIIKVSSPPEI